MISNADYRTPSRLCGRGNRTHFERVGIFGQHTPPAIQNAIDLWANATTDPESGRRWDLLRDKSRAVALFFTWAGKPPSS